MTDLTMNEVNFLIAASNKRNKASNPDPKEKAKATAKKKSMGDYLEEQRL